MKLLCIEDSELLSKYLKKALIYAGHTVDTALDGETGFYGWPENILTML